MYKKAKKSNNPQPKPQTQPAPATQPQQQPKPQAQPAPVTQPQQQPKPQAQPAPAYVSDSDFKELIKTVTKFTKASDHRFENAEKAIKEHEARLRALEGSSAPAQQPKPQAQPAPATQPQQPAPQPKPQTQPAPALQPKPQSAPQPKPQAQPAQPIQPPQSSQGATAPAKNVYLRKVYKVWEYEVRCFYFVLDIWAAKQADPEYTPVWAWVNAEGHIVRLLNKEELRKYLP